MTADADIARRVSDLIHGGWKAAALSTALRLGVPEALRAGPEPPQALAQRLGVTADGIARLLTSLVRLGVFTETGDGSFGHNEASLRLLEDHPQTQVRDARYTAAPVMTAAWAGLEHAVRGGAAAIGASTDGLAAYLDAHPAEGEFFRAYRAGVARHNLAALCAAYAFPEAGTVVMLGAGNLPALAGILRTRPGLHGILYDHLPVAGTAAPRREPAAEAGALKETGTRIAVVTGDWFRSVPAGCEAYVLPHILHDWPDDMALGLLERVVEAMPAASRVVVLAADTSAARGRLLPAYLDLVQLLLCGGRERAAAEYRVLLTRAGLDVISDRDAQARAGIRVLIARRGAKHSSARHSSARHSAARP